MKTHLIEWKHLDRNGRTCDRCNETGTNLRAVIRKLNASFRSRRVRFRLKETLLKPDRVAESNSIIIDGQPLETILPATRVTTTECGSCGELLGQPTDCRAVTKDGNTHGTIPEDIIHQALRKIAGAEPGKRNGSDMRKGGVSGIETAAQEKRIRFDASQGPRILKPNQGNAVDLRSVGVRFMAWGEETGGGFSLVEHPIPPKTLVAPMHLHTREDEYSFVLEGRMGAKLGDDVVYAEAGDFAFKPRNQWHTFWNPDDTPCRILEIISPAGFEHFFAELAARMAGKFDPNQLAELGATYGHYFKPETVADLCAEHGLRHPMLS